MNLESMRAKVDKVVEWALITILSVMTMNVLWQVVTRFVLRNPSSYTEELARYLLVWLGLLGAAYVVGKKMHLAIDLLPMRFIGKRKAMLEIVIQCFVFLFAGAVVLWGGIELVGLTLTLQQISAAMQIKLGYVYLVLPVSGALMMFYSGAFLLESVRVIRSGE